MTHDGEIALKARKSNARLRGVRGIAFTRCDQQQKSTKQIYPFVSRYRLMSDLEQRQDLLFREKAA